MKAATLRDMSVDELRQKLAELRESLFNLKFRHATGQLENTAQLKRHKRDIARVLTVLHEKQKVGEA
ncbi:MAG: 50S ribosomal protein L29 [Desulfosoma sp.]